MQIQCYTKDNGLLSRLHTLYGSENVTEVSNIGLLQESELLYGAVIVFDVKSYDLPQGLSFSHPLMVLTAVPTFSEGLALLQQGIRGYGNRHMRDSNLQQAIQNVYEGQIWLPPTLISRLISVVGQNQKTEKQNSKDTLLNALSKREREVALFVAKGMSNQEVADKLYVSLRTVKAHLSAIYEKTGVRNRLELGLALV
jgi:DNA-binding NarL/FixJ family response regulator